MDKGIMGRSRLYTMAGFCISLTIVLGGWFLTREMLQRKEAELLAGQGQISMKMKDFSIAMEEAIATEESVYTDLSEETMAEILAIWELESSVQYHEPMPGQIHMEQAIEVGLEWIRSMAEQQIFTIDYSERTYDDIYATLCTPETFDHLEKVLVGFWTVTYQSEDVCFTLKIHAATGQVWKADVSFALWDAQLIEACTDEELAAAAFPFLERGTTEIKPFVMGQQMIGVSKGQKVFVSSKRYMVTEGNSGSMEERLELSLNTGKMYVEILDMYDGDCENISGGWDS